MSSQSQQGHPHTAAGRGHGQTGRAAGPSASRADTTRQDAPGHKRARTAEGGAAARRFEQAFTFGHGRHLVRIGPVAFWTAVGSLVIMAAWSAVTATYFAFHDDVLTRLIARQADMQYAYEDRIAELRAQVDRVTSRQLLDQEQFERKFDTLMRRQSALESRAAAIKALADPLTTGSVKPSDSRGGSLSAAPAAPPAMQKPAIESPASVPAPDDANGQLRLRPGQREPSARLTPENRGKIAKALAQFQGALDRIEQRQNLALDRAAENYDSKARRMRAVLADLGVDVAKPGGKPSASGGPYVPIRVGYDPVSFERRIAQIKLARAQFDRLSLTLASVPVRKPLAGEIETSSGYGMRIDPFLRAPAMHTGLDFRGDAGDLVRATAAGKVTTAGWNGGYGKMVEIDHGNGFSTRYAHLSATEVDVGDRVRIGQVIGKIGSTGRSTGPHLHYETRVDGDPVDPQRFLRAGIRLGER